MKIGIIGLGVVGSACKYGFELIGYEVCIHDIKFKSDINNLINCDIIFVCVPTPEDADGSCDISNILQVITDLENLSYNGVVALKSTTMPGTTQNLINNSNLRICYVPEFLRERCANEDFVENHDLLVVGTDDEEIFQLIVKCHGAIPKHTVKLRPIEAELLKYYSNVFNALRVVFANSMFEICNKLGADYSSVKDAYLKRGTASSHYLDVNDNLRGYGGMCLPKDTNALNALVKQLGLEIKLFETIDLDNQKFKKTVFPGMRT
jgi:UDPglucose 6-dehydrogenase